MKIAGIIHARGTNTRTRNKNLYRINGKSLVRLACEKLLKCETIGGKYLNTEDDGVILECEDLESHGLQIIHRPPELAADYVTGNDLMAFALHSIEYCDVICELGAHAPLLSAETIDACISQFIENTNRFDSFLTVEKLHEHMWGASKPKNYELKHLPTKYELPPMLRETHGLYGIKTGEFLRAKSRTGKSPLLYELGRREAMDIHTWEDFQISRALLLEQRVQERTS